MGILLWRLSGLTGYGSIPAQMLLRVLSVSLQFLKVYPTIEELRR
jgi:hypothetical protein